jgi:hypothetical protein
MLSYSLLVSSDNNGGNGSRTSGAELEMDARCSLGSILASGLPLPKSPSFQKEEEAKGVVADAVQMEREERGWWSLRFQQVLHEIQRMDIQLIFPYNDGAILLCADRAVTDNG